MVCPKLSGDLIPTILRGVSMALFFVLDLIDEKIKPIWNSLSTMPLIIDAQVFVNTIGHKKHYSLSSKLSSCIKQ